MTSTDDQQPVLADSRAESQTPLKARRTSHIPAIDGLRGLAAMSVVFFHCWAVNGQLEFPQFSLFGVTVPLYRVLIPGYTGVYLFFVLSGFCLAYPFLSHPDKKDDWMRYALNRVRRILPPYIISFLLLFLIGQLLHNAQICLSEKFLYEPFKTHKFIDELFLIRKSRIVGSYWTLVLEWRWYLLFPALLLLMRRISPALVVAALFGVAYLAQTPLIAKCLESATFDLVVAFLPMFGMGIWAAHITSLMRNKPEALFFWERWLANKAAIGVVASLVLCLAFCPKICTGNILQFVAAWSPVYFFLVLAVIHRPWFQKLFGSRVFVKLGAISYSIYLLQEPVIFAGRYFIDRHDFGAVRLLSTNYLLMPTLCILAGLAFHYVGERPFLKR